MNSSINGSVQETDDFGDKIKELFAKHEQEVCQATTVHIARLKTERDALQQTQNEIARLHAEINALQNGNGRLNEQINALQQSNVAYGWRCFRPKIGEISGWTA
jgi:hypothetical protein